MTQNTEQKNRDYSQVRAGTKIGFDDAVWFAGKSAILTQGHIDGWDSLPAKPHFSPRLFSRKLWEKYSGYIISQPAEVRYANEQCSTNALHDVISERERQKSTEGWTEAHDDAYDLGEMASAASAYAYSASATPSEANILSAVPPVLWPWAREWWKPTTPRRDLVKAAALILAEIERLDRAALTREGGV